MVKTGKYTIIVASMVMIATWSSTHASVENIHAIFGNLLEQYVQGGVVDYSGFKAEETVLDRYLDKMADIDPAQLSRNEQMAFYINLYNAWTIKLILSKYPNIASIKELGGLFRTPWEKKIVHLNGRKVTLDDIEHQVLRPEFQDPRIHFAVNCASKSCPPPINRPYSGPHLDGQLDQATAAFINDPGRNYFDNGTLYVSRLFKWYRKDFESGIVEFFKRYARGELKKQIAAADANLDVAYLPYDWSLNRLR
ncbi:MAG: DUF547 domain-containing protein [Desulfatitalea sp.]|nr:DUF547 domain-containing protein [Desulfatitalea sp.]